MPKVKRLVLGGLLIAVAIVFRQFIRFSITPTLRISMSFVPYILSGWLLGPLWASITGVLADILGMALFPSGAFFPGYTFNEFLTCLIYGLFLYNRPVNKWLAARLAASLAIVHLLVQLVLNTLWLAITTGQTFWIIMPPRIIANIARFPIEFAAMIVVLRFLEKPVNMFLRTKPAAEIALAPTQLAKKLIDE